MPISRFVLVLAAAMQWLGLAGLAPPASAQEPGKGAFERFRHSFFEDENSARDGLDIASLRALQGDDRRRAEDMLLKFMPDTRAVIGLGELGSRRAGFGLVRLFNEQYREHKNDDPSSTYAIIFTAKALWQIKPDARWLDALTDVLTSAEYGVARQEAAQAFAVFKHPNAVPPLLKALDDPEDMVRHHAARALLILHGVADQADMSKASRESMIIRIMADEPPRRDEAKRDLLAAIAGRSIATP